jgi:hypothetical protein
LSNLHLKGKEVGVNVKRILTLQDRVHEIKKKLRMPPFIVWII